MSPQTWPCCYLRHGSSATSDMVAVLPQTWQWCHLRCCHRDDGSDTSGAAADMDVALPQALRYQSHGGSVTSGAATGMAVALPQVLLLTLRWQLRCHLRHGGSVALHSTSAALSPVSPGQTGTNHLHSPGSLQPAPDAGSALVSNCPPSSIGVGGADAVCRH